MANTFKWVAPEAIQTYYSSALDGLASSSFSTSGGTVSNETDLYPYIAFELFLSTFSPSSGAFADIWIDYKPDGTNFSDANKSLQTASLLCTLPLDIASTTQRIVSQICTIMPMDFRLQLRNMTTAALAATGNTLKYRRFFDQSV